MKSQNNIAFIHEFPLNDMNTIRVIYGENFSDVCFVVFRGFDGLSRSNFRLVMSRSVGTFEKLLVDVLRLSYS